MAASPQKGAQASLGGKGNCLKPLSPFAANAKFIVTARSILVLTRLYQWSVQNRPFHAAKVTA